MAVPLNQPDPFQCTFVIDLGWDRVAENLLPAGGQKMGAAVQTSDGIAPLAEIKGRAAGGTFG